MFIDPLDSFAVRTGGNATSVYHSSPVRPSELRRRRLVIEAINIPPLTGANDFFGIVSILATKTRASLPRQLASIYGVECAP